MARSAPAGSSLCITAFVLALDTMKSSGFKARALMVAWTMSASSSMAVTKPAARVIPAVSSVSSLVPLPGTTR